MTRFPHPADMPDVTGGSVPMPYVLRCPNRAGTWIDENMADEVQAAVCEALGDYLTSFRDEYDKAKLRRVMLELAHRCEDAILKADADEKAAWDRLEGAA